MHPHIPPIPPELVISTSSAPSGLKATIRRKGQTFSFPLPIGHAERVLSNALLHLTSGIPTGAIIEHFHTHMAGAGEPSCPCCKLEGRVLTASGRRPVSEADRLIAARAHTGGTVQVRHIKQGLSGAQLRAYEEAYFKREAKPTKPDYPEPVKFVKQSIEELI